MWEHVFLGYYIKQIGNVSLTFPILCIPFFFL